MVKSLIAVAALLVASPVAAQSMTVAAPTAEAEALGKRVAETGTLATLLPLLISRDTLALISEHPELDDASKAKLGAAADATALTEIERLMSALGHQYAVRLSVPDLRALAAFNDSPAAKAKRAVEPQVILETIQSIGGFDFKRESWAAYCESPGVTCPAPEANAK